MLDQKKDTRKALINAAGKLFAEKGFYGTSIRMVAEQVGITKPSLLHHFPSKEKLYAAVMARIADGILLELEEDIAASQDPREQLQLFIDGLTGWLANNNDDAVILMRDLLDNPKRSEHIGTWHLRPLIERLVAIVEAGQASGKFRALNALSFVYNLLGAQHYFMISQATLQGMLPAEDYRALVANQAPELKAWMQARLLVQ